MDKALIVDKDKNIEKIREGYRNIINEKDEKIEELINMCDSKDEEIKRLTLISDESLKDKIHAERTGRQLDVFRAKVECAADILNNLI